MELKKSVAIYLPGIFELMSEEAPVWQQLNEHAERMAGTHEANGAVNYLLTDASIYQLLHAAEAGNESALRLLGFMNTVLRRLVAHLSGDGKVMAWNALYKVLTDPEPTFRSFVGKLAVLNAILERKENMLAGIETDIIANSAAADFTISVDLSPGPELIVVANIQLDDIVDDIVALLGQIIAERILQKIGTAAEYNSFTLIPVLWAPVPVLQKLSHLYRSGRRLSFENVAEPFAYCIFYNDDSQAISRFSPISALFDPFTKAQA